MFVREEIRDLSLQRQGTSSILQLISAVTKVKGPRAQKGRDPMMSVKEGSWAAVRTERMQTLRRLETRIVAGEEVKKDVGGQG